MSHLFLGVNKTDPCAFVSLLIQMLLLFWHKAQFLCSFNSPYKQEKWIEHASNVYLSKVKLKGFCIYRILGLLLEFYI